MAGLEVTTDMAVNAQVSAGRDARLAYILDHVNEGRFVPLRDITRRFGVTMQTARRDLALLESQEQLIKVHGGAMPREDPDPLSVEERLSLHDAEKRRIAAAAAVLVKEGDALFLDGGSTIAFLAPLLFNRRLHVVTNALSVAQTLKRGWPGVEVILTGGYYFPKSELLLGPPAVQAVQHLQVNKAFLSAAGVTPEGVFNAHMLVVDLEQAVIARAMETYLLVDASKLDRTSLVRVCGLEAIHTMITAEPVPAPLAAAAEAAGCSILICPEAGKAVPDNIGHER
jgi:DeoR family transcriptional regulator of aga operon